MALAGGLFGPFYAVYVEDIGGDILIAGEAFAIFSISSGILIYFISKWGDHVKHTEKLLVFSRALTALGFLGYVFVSDIRGLFIVQIILGAAVAIGIPAIALYIVTIFVTLA